MQVEIVSPPLRPRVSVPRIRHLHEFARLSDRIQLSEHLDVVNGGRGCVPLRRFSSTLQPDSDSLVALALGDESLIDLNIILGVDARSRRRLEVREVLDPQCQDGGLNLQSMGRHVANSLCFSERQGFVQLLIRDYPIWAMDRRNQTLDDAATLVHDRDQEGSEDMGVDAFEVVGAVRVRAALDLGKTVLNLLQLLHQIPHVALENSKLRLVK